MIFYLKAIQNHTMTRKRPCSLSSGADRDITLAITFSEKRQEIWTESLVKRKMETPKMYWRESGFTFHS